jgi:hypothetical protein
MVHVAWKGNKINELKDLLGNPKEKIPLGERKSIWEDNINIYLGN